jgi:hypothetical protein
MKKCGICDKELMNIPEHPLMHAYIGHNDLWRIDERETYERVIKIN